MSALRAMVMRGHSGAANMPPTFSISSILAISRPNSSCANGYPSMRQGYYHTPD